MATSLVSPSLYTSASRISPDFGHPQTPNPINLRPKTLPLRPLKSPGLWPLCAYANNPRIYRRRRRRVGEGAGRCSTAKDRTENPPRKQGCEAPSKDARNLAENRAGGKPREQSLGSVGGGLDGADLMGFLQEGKVEEAVGHMDQGICADYAVFGALLESCGSSKSLDLGKRVHDVLRSLCFSVLVIFVEGPRSMLVKVWLLVMATVGLVMVRSSYIGPAMNLANAFDGQAPAEQDDDEQ